MAKNIFDEDDVSEYEIMASESQIVEDYEDGTQDILDEYEEESEPVAPVKKGKKPTLAYPLSNKDNDIMRLAMVQLEQAKLYDMFLKHNLFEGVKADPEALRRVEKELKDFILERMQVLLGMKEDNKSKQVQQIKVELPFNEIEVDFLKALAFKGTRGESANSKPAEAKTLTTLKPKEEPQFTGLKSIAHSTPAAEEIEEEEEEEFTPAPVKKKVAPVKKQLPPRPPQKRPIREGKIISVEEAAREDLKKMAKRKPAHLMTPEELVEANRNITNGNKPKATGGIPMPSADQQATHYMTQQLQKQMSPDNNVLMTMLADKLKFSMNTVQQVGDDE